MATAQDETKITQSPEQTPAEIAKYWLQQVELAKKDTKDFFDDGDKVVDRYRGADKALKGSKSKRLNILYSNTEVLRAAVYGRSAKPDVRRRFGIEDELAGRVAEILEKGLVYCAETYDSDRPIELAILDYLLPGRGVVRICYEPVVGQDNSTIPPTEYVIEQHLYEEYVYWKDFLVMPARTWADVVKDGWVGFKQRMTRQDLVKNFGADIGTRVPLNWMPEHTNKKDTESDTLKKAEVIEIWSAPERKRYWIVEGFQEPLRVDDDPYGLEDFFPLPEPPTFYASTDSITPEPGFHAYKDQADDLDEIIGRISRLTRALKRRGVYDMSVKELGRLANASDNQFIPVENYQSLASKGGLAAAFQTEDISIIANVLVQLYQQRDMLVQAIWETVGIADIMRGQTNASETLGAQQLKAQFGSQRLMRRQREVQRWVRDLLKLKAEILAEHYEPQQLQMMTGVQITPEIMQILRTDKLRGYRIDIETDSTVFENAEDEKKSRSEMIQAVTTFIQGWGPMVQAAPPLAPVAFELLKFGIGAFKATRPIEDAIEQAAGVFEQQAAQAAAQGPKPSPEEMKVQGQLQLEQTKAQTQAQLEQTKAQAEAQRGQQEMQMMQQKHDMELQHMQAKHSLEVDRHHHSMQMDREKMVSQQQADQQQFDFKRELESKAGDASKELAMAKVAKMTGDEMKPEELTQALQQAIAPIAEGAAQMQQQVAQHEQQLAQMIAQSMQQ